MAAYIPEDIVASIRNASDIVAIISEVVSLRQSGHNFLGLCPFHAEKTPSFTVSPHKQIFYCFGCGAGGNVFTFLMKHDGLTFPEAVKELAQRYGIDLPTRNLSPLEKKKLTERETILSLNGEAAAFYHDCLIAESSGSKAKSYLLKRGMTQKTIDEFKIGFAPDGWDHLINHFHKRKMSVELAIKAGLVVPRKKGDGYYDRFRNRVVFPIFSWQNQAMGFGGRVMDDALPKYLNSPETPVYDKSRSLYGLNRARHKCRKIETVYVVEGYFDLLTMHQFGIENTVATLGTALTAAHVQLLKGFVGEAGKAILVYDSDLAGIKAAERSVAVFQKGLLPARILVLPKGHDPDSFLMADGPESFLKAVARSIDMFTFMANAAVEKHGLSVDGKVRIVNDLKKALVSIDDPVGRSLHIKQLAERIGVDEAVIIQKVRQPADDRPGMTRMTARQAQKPASGLPPSRGPSYRLERQMVSMMLQFPEMIAEIAKRRLLVHFTDPILTGIGQEIVKHFSDRTGDLSDLISDWGDAEQKAVIARLSLSDENWDRAGCMNLVNQFETFVSRRDTALQKRIEEAEKNGDEPLLAALLQEKQQQARRAKGI